MGISASKDDCVVFVLEGEMEGCCATREMGEGFVLGKGNLGWGSDVLVVWFWQKN